MTSAAYGRGFIEIEPQAAGLSGFQSSLSGAMAGIAKSAAVVFTAAFAAAVATGIKGTRAFADLEKGMNEVFTLMPDISGAAMDEMTGQVRAFAKDFGTLSSDVVPALYQAISAGVPQDNVFDFLEVAQRAAIGGVTDLETAVDGISSVVNAYGSDVLSASEASDALFTAVRLGKTDFGALSSSIFNVAPIASSMGVAFDDVAAALAAVTGAGTPTSVAATQIRAALAELGKEGTKASDIFKETAGVGFQQFIDQGGNLEDALQVMKSAADESGLSVLDLFGSIEAGQGALTLTESRAEEFAEAMEEMAGKAGATEIAYERMDQGMSRTWDRIRAHINDALIEVGARLAPHVAEFSEWFAERLPDIIETVTDWFGDRLVPAVRGAVDWFRSNVVPVIRDQVIPAIQGIVRAVSAVVAWFQNLSPETKGLLKDLALAVGAAIVAAKAFLGIVAAFKAVGAAFKVLSALMATNPWLVLIAATVALVVLVVRNWDTITGFLRRIWDWITKTVGAVGQAISTAFRTAVEFVRRLFLNFTPLGLIIKNFDTIKRVASGVKDWIVARFTELVSFFAGMPRRIANAIRGLWDGIKDTFRSAINWVIQKWNNLKIEMRIPAGIPLIGGSGFTINTPNIPLFHEGGIVPGPAGSEMLAILKAGERVLSTAEVARGEGGMTVVNNIQTINAGKALVRQMGREVAWAMRTGGI